MTTLEIIEDEVAFQQLAGDWQRLNDCSPMQAFTWLNAWWQACKTPQDRLSILVVRQEDDSTVIGIVPWYRRSNVALGSTLRFLGDGRACSDFQTFLCQPNCRDEVLATVVAWLSGQGSASAHWDLLDLEGISINDPLMNAFAEAMSARGHVTHQRDTEHTWRLDISGGWDGFLAGQSKTQRNQSRNFVNRFDKSDLQLRFASEEPDRVDLMSQELMRLHALRWQAVGLDGCFATSTMKEFFAHVMSAMVVQGVADISMLERDGRPIAANAWLIQDRTLYAYQCGRDPAEDSNRVGRIMQAVSVRWACQRGFEAIDFLRGDEVYKSQMHAQPTLCQRRRIVARAPLPQLRHNLWLACRDVKSRFDQLRKPVEVSGE